MFRLTKTLLIPMIALSFLGCTDDSDNLPPTVVLNGTPGETFVVGEEMSITVDAQDPEGGTLTFAYDFKPKTQDWTVGSRAEFLTFSSSALFTWDPLASDALVGEPIQLVFIVTDNAGKVTEKTVTTNIVPGNGLPVFTSNVSEIFDPRTGKPLIFEVKVSDNDSPQVDLQMDESTAPVGAEFSSTGPFSGEFVWDPSVDQLDKRVRTIRFTANDGDNPEVEFNVTVVVRAKGKIDLTIDQTDESCPGESVIQHQALGPQYGFDDYPIEVSLNNGDRFDQVVVFFSLANALNADFTDGDDDKDQLASIELTKEGNNYVGIIGNQAATAAQETTGFVTGYYQVCAFDNDAAGADAVVCSPSSGELELFNMFTAYGDAAEGECLDDGLEALSGNDTFEDASPASTTWDTKKVCEGNPDFFAVRARPGTSFVGIIYPDGAALDIVAYDENQSEIPVSKSSCTGMATFDTTVADGESPKQFYIQLNGNDIPYSVRFFEGEGAGGDCVDDALEPNDTAFDAAEVSDGDSESAEICFDNDKDIYKIELNAGDVLTVDLALTNANGNLDMELYPPSQADDAGVNLNGVASTFSFDDAEQIAYTALETGFYYLYIFSNDTPNTYAIDFAVTAAPPCPDTDSFSSVGAGNHTADNAALISSSDDVTESNLQVCPGKSDFYRRTEFNGVNAVAAVEVTGGDGTLADVSFEVTDLQGTVLETGVVSGSELFIDWTPSYAGAPKAFIYKVSTTSRVTYDLTILR